MVKVAVTRNVNFVELGVRWQDLERRSNGSFFQSWTWVGCLCAERFPDPVVVEATDAGRTVALGLFNRVARFGRRTRLFLGENGSAERDCPYVEQNGILAEAGREGALTALCLLPLIAAHDIVFSGVGETMMGAAHGAAGLVVTSRVQASPFIDLAAVRRCGGDYLTGRSANTRQQVRRSDRLYEREGPLVLQCADTLAAAHAMLDRLAELHQAVWRSRGKPGSFARPFFGRFHHTLIDRGFPDGAVTMLRISSAGAVIGYLYNFVWTGRMSAYQSGFHYRDQASHARPGLTCHHQAIVYASGQGLDTYDFLAGDDRYKRSLAERSHQQFWAEAGPIWSPRLLLTRLRLRRV